MVKATLESASAGVTPWSTHPYSQALFSAAPVADPEAAARKTRIILSGDVPSAVDPPCGCCFHTRCRYRKDVCVAEAPALRAVAGRLVRCHFAGKSGFPPAPTAAAAVEAGKEAP